MRLERSIDCSLWGFWGGALDASTFVLCVVVALNCVTFVVVVVVVAETVVAGSLVADRFGMIPRMGKML